MQQQKNQNVYKLPLTFAELTGKRINLHTHTTRCNHAKGEDREYVEKAIEAGFDVLGFSDHSPHMFDHGYVSRIRMSMESGFEDYVTSIENLKKEYEKDIQIFCGLETEYFPSTFERTMEKIMQYPIDYMILGQHFLDDEMNYQHVGWKAQSPERLKQYVDCIIEGLSRECFLYVAHPDVISCATYDDAYLTQMTRLAKELKARNIPIELNMGGYGEALHYPNPVFTEIGIHNGNDFLIGVDAHSPSELTNHNTYMRLANTVPRERLLYANIKSLDI